MNGLQISSAQVKVAVIDGFAGITFAKMFFEEPNFLKLCCSALFFGGASVAVTRVAEKSINN